MDNGEKAIRNALLKIDASDKAIRKQIYKTAWQAHERSIIADKLLNKTARIQKRDNLRQIIHNIEAEFKHDYISVESPITHENIPSKPTALTNEPITEAQIDITLKEDKAQNYEDIDFEEKISNDEEIAIKNKRHSALFITILCFILLIIVGLLAIFYFYNNTIKDFIFSEKVPAPLETTTNVTPINEKQKISNNSPVRPTNIQHEDIVNNNNDGYINILTPNNANTLATLGAASIELRNKDGVNYLHIFANSAEDAAIINIGEGALNAVRGKNIMLDIDARSEGTESTQMSISCDLGQYKNCGRRRFNVPRYRDNIILQIHIPADSQGPAKLFLNSDVFGEGHAINIYAIRFKPVE